MTARREPKPDWPRLVQAYLSRSCTQEAFCEQHGINPSTLAYHVNKATRRERFVPAVCEEQRPSEIVLELPEGITLTLRR